MLKAERSANGLYHRRRNSRTAKTQSWLEVSRGWKGLCEEPVHVTDKTFNDVVCQNILCLIDFWADWCGPCHTLAPTIKELAREYKNRVFVGKLNVDESPSTAECFQVYSIPTMLIMKNGKEVDRVVGCVPREHIENALKKHLG